MNELKLEMNAACKEPPPYVNGKSTLLVTPPIGEDYWLFRVAVSDQQAIVGFPKFLQIGIGFQVEEDWNTNLPSRCTAEQIFKHIAHNKGDDSIPDERCIEAIKLVQQAAEQWHAKQRH